MESSEGKKEISNCINVHKKDVLNYLDKYVVNSLIDLGIDNYILVIRNNLHKPLLSALNNKTEHSFSSEAKVVKNNNNNII